MAFAADASEDAALLCPEQEEVVLRGQTQKHCVGAKALSMAAVAALACMGWIARGHHRSVLSEKDEFQVKQAFQVNQATAQCPQMETNVEYRDETSGFGMNFDHIPSADLCCALCQANEQCQSFTWVQNAGLDGNPSQCWIKGGVGIKVPNSMGKVSGIPPQRVPVQSVPPGKGSQTPLWCFSLMNPVGGELALLQWQYNHQASIFACDAFAVYSNQQIEVAPGVYTKIAQSDLKCGYGGDSQTALNSWIFIAVWQKIVTDGEYQAYQWVVKVDPDCVFFPDRLIQILPAYAGVDYIENCRYGMHGPIEVISSAAVNQLAGDYAASADGMAPKRCVESQHFGQWGEDMFMDQCLYKILGLTNRPLDARIVCEDHCECPDFYWCQKGSDRVSYHPFKTVGAYEECMANALQDQTPAALTSDLQTMAPGR